MKKPKLKDSCLTCARYLSCSDPNKSFSYICSKFQSFSEANKKEKATKKEKLAKPAIKKKREKTQEGDDFTDIVTEVIRDEKKTPLPRDLRIDDRDIPLAPNFFTFVTKSRYLNITPYPFAKQLEIGTLTFAEYCPRCSNKKYIKNVPVADKPEDFRANVKLLKWGVCPRCKATKQELWKAGELKVPCELVGLAGQRASKSTTFSMLAAYHLHSYLKNPSPQRMFGLLPTQDLHAQFTALTYQKAKDLLWDPIWNQLSTTPWFRNYHEMLNYHQEKLGAELYSVKDTYARYRHRNLFLYPVGPDRNKIRGTTAFQGGIDEIGLFDADENNQKIKMNGDEVWTSLRNSFRTLRSVYYKSLRKRTDYNAVLPPFLGAISSPLSKRDMIVRLYERTKGSEFMHGFHYCISGDSFIYTDVGIKKISALYKESKDTCIKTRQINQVVLGMHDYVNACEVHYSGKKFVYRVVTTGGLTIKASENHEFLMHDRIAPYWLRLMHLSPGDAICVNPDRATQYKLDKIKLIEPVGEEDTYDLSVNCMDHAFIANGIIVHNSTWEMNPNVTRADLKEDFELDPVKALRDFGAVPPNSSLPYIDKIELIKPSMSLSLKNRAELIPTTVANNFGDSYRSGDLIFKASKDRNPRVLALDAGIKNNHFGIAAGYYDEKLNRPVLDTLLELRPTRDHPINFNYIYRDVLSPLVDGLNVKMVVSDRFQNMKILHDISDEFDIDVKTYTLKYREFVTYKSDMLNGAITFPLPEMFPDKIERAGEKSYPEGFHMRPVSHFIYQMLTVRDTEKEVTKGEGVTDDIFRAAVLAYTFLINPDYRELFSGQVAMPRMGRQIMGSVGSYGQKAPGLTNYKNLGTVGSFSNGRRFV